MLEIFGCVELIVVKIVGEVVGVIWFKSEVVFVCYVVVVFILVWLGNIVG